MGGVAIRLLLDHIRMVRRYRLGLLPSIKSIGPVDYILTTQFEPDHDI